MVLRHVVYYFTKKRGERFGDPEDVRLGKLQNSLGMAAQAPSGNGSTRERQTVWYG
jgi:hypothetical protein